MKRHDVAGCDAIHPLDLPDANGTTDERNGGTLSREVFPMAPIAGTGSCLVSPGRVYGLGFAVAVFMAAAHFPVYSQPKQKDDQADKADRATSVANLRRLAIAVQDYEDQYGSLPPPSIDSKDGKALLSWRVALLPFLGEDELYKQFRLNEAWDSKHNSRLLAKRPAAYTCPGPELKEKYTTYYQAFVGKECPFGPDRKVNRGQISNGKGCSRTLLFVEAGASVPWTRPVDLAYDAKKPLPKVGGRFRDGFHACFCDGAVRFVKRDIPNKLMRQMISMEDGGWDEDVKDYFRPLK